jgi:hypothetical protein
VHRKAVSEKLLNQQFTNVNNEFKATTGAATSEAAARVFNLQHNIASLNDKNSVVCPGGPGGGIYEFNVITSRQLTASDQPKIFSKRGPGLVLEDTLPRVFELPCVVARQNRKLTYFERLNAVMLASASKRSHAFIESTPVKVDKS